MERKRSTKSIRRLSLRRPKPAEMNQPNMPLPNVEFEDVLASQLQVSDVINNSVLGDGSMHNLTNNSHSSPHFRRHQSCLYHRCYHNTTLVPLWQAFAALDTRNSGKLLLGRLMRMSSVMSSVLGVEQHSDQAIQKYFIQFSQITFPKYKSYVMDTTAGKILDPEALSAYSWSICKDRYLNNPLVDNLDSVVPPELAQAIYWLYCIFNNLTEPDTYPPSMDYEETDLLLRKLFAALGLAWTSNDLDSQHYDDASSDSNSNFEPSYPPHVTFQQLLSIIADLIGTELARSHAFYRAVQRLCLSEYMEVMKTGWINVRKPETDVWKKRWAALHGSKFTLYSGQTCLDSKEEINLSHHMHIEALPATGSQKHRFRIVEKEGDFSITSEHEFSTATQKSCLSWLTLLSVAIKVTETGMSAKTCEISERRLERFQRRESEREVYRKKRDVLETFDRLQEAKKARSEVEDALAQRSQLREAKMIHLLKMDKIYERLESIQFQQSLCNKAERERGLLRLLTSFERKLHGEDRTGNSAPNSPEKSDQKSMLTRLAAERDQLEHALEELRMTPSHPPANHNTSSRKPSLVIHRVESLPLEGSFDYRSSSENMSTTSTDFSHLTLPDITLHT
uniref:Switch-associated protein 70-like n=1 Tax=Phallusia mammillata TaxID=59560 RepID=A0A6F9DV44_9ASCI|nr:switch-associated protein 70-like [Phallusia mammillata]